MLLLYGAHAYNLSPQELATNILSTLKNGPEPVLEDCLNEDSLNSEQFVHQGRGVEYALLESCVLQG